MTDTPSCQFPEAETFLLVCRLTLRCLEEQKSCRQKNVSGSDENFVDSHWTIEDLVSARC